MTDVKKTVLNRIMRLEILSSRSKYDFDYEEDIFEIDCFILCFML